MTDHPPPLSDLSTPLKRVVLALGCAEALPALEAQGFACRLLGGLDECRQALQAPQVRALVVRLEGEEMASAVRIANAEAPLVDTLVWMPERSPEEVRVALQLGARDVVLGPAPEALAKVVARIIERQRFLPRLQEFKLARSRSRSSRFEGLVTKSARMWELFETAVQVAPSGASVLVLGETGVGKELVARAIHKHSGRSGRFVPLNCGSIPDGLIDSELFGHEEGTFTGATRSTPGLFRSAEGGTLFLDEVGNLSPAGQYSLLRALQEEAVRPVGSDREVPVDVRIIAATSVSLDEAVEAGAFREDLLFRLDVIRLVIPPLRERPEDVLHLFSHFRRRLSRQYRLDPPLPNDAFLEALLAHDWPGNVRELENLAERVVLTHHGKRLTKRHFQALERPTRTSVARPSQRRAAAPARPAAAARPSIDLSRSLADTIEPVVEELERRYLEAALRAQGGRIGQTAAVAGLSPRTLLRKLKRHGIDKAKFRGV